RAGAPPGSARIGVAHGREEGLADAEARDATRNDEGHQLRARDVERLDQAARNEHEIAREVVRLRQVDGDVVQLAELREILAGDEAEQLDRASGGQTYGHGPIEAPAIADEGAHEILDRRVVELDQRDPLEDALGRLEHAAPDDVGREKSDERDQGQGGEDAETRNTDRQELVEEREQPVDDVEGERERRRDQRASQEVSRDPPEIDLHARHYSLRG